MRNLVAGVTLVLLSMTITCWAEDIEDPQTAFDALVDRYYKRALELQPLAGTQVGEDHLNSLLPELSDAARQKVEDLYTWCFGELQNIDCQVLNPEQQLTFEILDQEVSTGLQGMRYPDHLLPVADSMVSLPILLPTFADPDGVQPFRDVADYRAFLERLEAFPSWVDQAIINMKKGIKKGVTQPRSTIERAVPTLSRLATAKGKKSPFFEPLRHMPSSVTGEDRRNLTSEYLHVIDDVVAPAYSRLARFVEDEYLPECRSTIGMNALPNGTAWYRHLVRFYTTTDKEPEQIFEIGLAEVDRVVAEMNDLVEHSSFGKNPRLFFDQMYRSSEQRVTSPAEALREYRRIGRKIDHGFSTLFSIEVKAGLLVRLMDKARANAVSAAHYQRARADGTRPGVFFVNPKSMPRAKSGMEALYLHEAVPGHHYQLSVALERTELPEYRRYLYQGAYLEGWALYAEGLGEDLGLYRDSFQRYGRLRMELLRSARLMADVAIHHLGWERHKVEQLLQARALGAGVYEIDRYIAWPGQALGYKIGEIKIRELRSRAEKLLGDRFDIRDFHDEILKHGALPLDILDGVISRWIVAQRPVETP